MKGKMEEPVVKKKSSVAVEETTRKRLDSYGQRHETYDQIINRVLDFYDQYKDKAKK
ncbi:MAG: hypothetical protein M3044_10170 [Thermoproteota archaeon]|nr:hypothetical protein [Thermoproteota archaeon]